MPDDRLIHRAFGRSEKINKLTDFEKLVWLIYKLAADDFGVMVFSASPLRTAATFLDKRPERVVVRALEAVREVGLVSAFTHQGSDYLYQFDWQTWQKIIYPRPTKQPAPARADLDLHTAWLFEHHPEGGKMASWQHPTLREPSRKNTGLVRKLSGKVPRVSRDTYTDTNTLTSTEGGVGETDPVQRLVARHDELYLQFCGVNYIGNPQKDYHAACQLVQAFPDPSMQDAILTYGLNDADPFMAKDTRTIPKIACRASKYAEELKAQKLA